MTNEHSQPHHEKGEANKAAETSDEAINFSELKQKAQHWWKKFFGKVPEKNANQKSEDEFSINVSSITSELKKHARWLIPLLCIVLAMSVSIYFRTMPQRMPITDQWAENAVHNFYKNQIAEQINQQYPNLPAQNREVQVAQEWKKYLEENQEQLDRDINQLSQQFKNQFRNDEGTLYLLGIDPYYYYRQSEYVLKNGYPASDIKDGVLWDYYRLAPIGREAEWNFHNWFGAVLHKFMNLFGDYPLLYTFFFVGTIFSALTIIPAFFIGRFLTKNNAGGFFTAMLIAVAAFFVSRTTGESSDTDVYAVFFPVLIAWLFLEALEAKTLKKKLLWMGTAGIATGIFSFAWTGWWYIAGFIIATTVLGFIYDLIVNRKNIPATIKSLGATSLYTLLPYFGTMFLSVSALTSFRQFKRVILGPFQFLLLKAVGVYSYWPNIRTTVAELNVVSLKTVIEQLGGKFLFVLAVLGIIFLLFRKNEEGKRQMQIPILLIIWMAASLFATTKGMRFILQVTPVFSIALGAFMGIAWQFASSWAAKGLKVNSKASKIVVFLLASLLLIQPISAGYNQAYQSVPSMNDAWYNALTKIKNEAPQNSIITSWWDFGHWFKAIADRPVTFDGGTQVGWGAHWVGKSLLTNDERVTVGIVRMLNCGQNSAFDMLDAIFNDTIREIDLINKIIIQDKSAARNTLVMEGLTAEQAEEILPFTHCDAPADYYIASEDMVGKAGVWGHFGSWDFRKAVMYQKTRNEERQEAIVYLVSNFNLTPEEADAIHAEIQSTPADRWIAPWPGYLASSERCQKLPPQILECTVNLPQGGTIVLHIDFTTFNATFKTNNGEVNPASLVYADREGVQEKKYPTGNKDFSVVVIPKGDEFITLLTDQAHAYGTFTKLFFFNGHGMKCFSKFDEKMQSGGGGKISTWIIDYGCKQNNKAYFLPVEEVQAAHILISTETRSDEEALAIISDLKKNVTMENFGDYAKKYSDDQGTKENSGSLGWFRQGIMVPEFEKAAFSLNKGQISDVVKTQFGYHIIYVTDKRKR